MVVQPGHFNKGIAFALMYRILHDLSKMSVRAFVQAMKEYDSHNDSLVVTGLWAGRDRGVVWELEHTNAAMLPADSIHCHFYGGPPGSKALYKGTLLTMLMDRVMICAISRGYGAVGKLFPEERLTSGYCGA
jgi:hypothetical protein